MAETLADLTRQVGLTSNEFELLRRVPVFQGVNNDQWPGLLRIMTVENYPRNRLLFCQGDPSEHFYVVLDGWVRIYRSLPNGGEVTVSLFARGESFAEAAIFAGGTYPVTGLTANASKLLLISANGMRGALEGDSKLAIHLLASMSAKMHDLVRQIEQLSHRTTLQRVAAFLLTLAENQHSLDIRLPLDKHLIAARLGMQPESFSRALTKLRDNGVESDGDMLHLKDLDQLRRLLARD